MVKTIALNLIIPLIKSMMDKGLAKEIEDLVRAAFNFKGTSEERKARVMAELKDVGGIAGEALAGTSNWLIDLLISAIVGKYRPGK